MAILSEGPREHHCHACDGRVEMQRKPGRRDDCSHCGAALHACLNCVLFDPSGSRGCREPQAEDVREKSRGNFCGWFEFKSGAKPRGGADEAANAAASAFFGGVVETEANPMRGFDLERKTSEPDPMARFFAPEPRDAVADLTRAHKAFEALVRKPKKDDEQG